MCIKCEVKRFNECHTAFITDIAEALADAITVIESMKKRGVELTEQEAKVYKQVFDFATDGEEYAEPNKAEAIVDVLKQAFPGAKIVVGSPQEVEAMVENIANEANGHKPN